MGVSDEKLNHILRYFDDDLTDEEVTEFMKQLQNDSEMLAAFDQQILMSASTSMEYVIPENINLESADDYLARVQGIIDYDESKPGKVIHISTKKYYNLAAAILFLIALSGILYYLFGYPHANKSFAKKQLPQNSNLPAQDNSIKKQPDEMLAFNILPQDIFKQYYKVLPNDALDYIPAEATPYQYKYNKGSYKEMASESESTLITKGENTTDIDVTNYFNFYKALANLQINETTISIRLLQKIRAENNSDKKLKQQVKWYLLMSYLKAGDKENSLSYTTLIMEEKNNPYYRQAAEIKLKLQNKLR